MRKTRFFYRTNCLLLALLGWGCLLNEAALREGVRRKQNTSVTVQVVLSPTVTPSIIPKKQKETKTATEQDDPQEIKIRVLLMDSDHTTYEHEAVSGRYDGKEFFYTADSQEVQDGELILHPENGKITITSIERQCKEPVYQGELMIRKKGQKLYLINELSLEEYLRAVVPSEMPSAYEKQALMAQAICARTYAWKQILDGGISEYGADVDDSVSYQVYGNILPQDSTDEAVEKTKGLIMTKENEPIEAYYFSTSAGMTSTDEVWGAQETASYLKRVVCDFDEQSPWRNWSVTIPWENLQRKIVALSGGEQELLSVEAVRKNESGAVTRIQAVTKTDVFYIDQEYEVREFLSPEGCMITEKDGTQTQGGKLLPSAYFTLRQTQGEGLEITGSGYGHGVGMSQTAANEMAKEGYSYQEILDYFFNEVTIGSISEYVDK